MYIVARAVVLAALILATNITYVFGVLVVWADGGMFWPTAVAVIILAVISAAYWFVFHEELQAARDATKRGEVKPEGHQ